MSWSEAACIEIISQLESKDFSEPLHQDIFDLASSIYADGIHPTGAVLIKEGMKYGFIDSPQKMESFQHVMGEYVGDDIQYWIDRVSNNAKNVAFASVLKKYQLGMEEQEVKNIDDMLGQAIGDLSLISAGRNKNNFEDGEQVADVLEKLMKEKEARFEQLRVTGEAVLEGLPTGFAKLDEVTLGYKPGDLIVLGAQTGHGKTAFALQTAKKIAVELKRQVLYINTEMSKELIYMRFAANIAGVPFYNIRQGNLVSGDGNDRGRFNKALKSIRGSGFIHKYSPELTPTRCIMDARKAKIQKKIDMLIIDYVGRMEKFDPKLQEWQVLEQIVKSQKILAQELKIPVMVLVQLNPDGSLQGAKRIKNECDMLLKLCPIGRDEQESYRDYKNANYRLYVDKNRDGDSDLNIPLRYDKQIQRLEVATLDSSRADFSDLGKEVRGR
jgi:replicative DNA helicase